MENGALGVAVVAVGAFCNGTFGVPLKLARRRNSALPGPIFQSYFALGCAVASFATMPINSAMFDEPYFVWTPLGIVAGSCFALATVFYLLAIHHLGVAVPPSLLAGAFVMAGVVEDIVFLRAKPKDNSYLAFSLAIILLSIAGVAASKKISKGAPAAAGLLDQRSIPNPVSSPSHTEQPIVNEELSKKTTGPSLSFLVGVAASVGVGLFGSLVPFTSKYATNVSPFGFVACFGIGELLAHCVMNPMVCLIGMFTGTIDRNMAAWGSFDRHTILYGSLSGILWGTGNACLGFGLTSRVPFPVALSIYQCSLFVSALWGVILFREIQGFLPIGLLLLSGTVLIGAIVLESVEMP